ncbi:hypothetical protein HPB47_021535, partial [Ixodes persulcatus]
FERFTDSESDDSPTSDEQLETSSVRSPECDTQPHRLLDRLGLDETPPAVVDGPFQCNTCESQFPSQLLLDTHWIENHVKKEGECRRCFCSCRATAHRMTAVPEERTPEREGESLHCENSSSRFPEKEADDGDCPVMKREPEEASEQEGESLHYESTSGELSEKEQTDRGSHAMKQEPIETHGEGEGISCSYCDTRFASQELLIVHKWRVHRQGFKHRCRFCSYTSRRNSCLTKHERIHTGEKPFSCKVCKKAFTQKNHLTSHEVVHATERPFACELCPRKFPLEVSLRAHVRFHVRPFKCDVCGKTYAERSHLAVHQRTHGIERSYRCKTCGETFSTGEYLAAHRKVHTDDFVCNICGREFITPFNLRRHKRVHARGKP